MKDRRDIEASAVLEGANNWEQNKSSQGWMNTDLHMSETPERKISSLSSTSYGLGEKVRGDGSEVHFFGAAAKSA
jgi:hypothetical protein